MKKNCKVTFPMALLTPWLSGCVIVSLVDVRIRTPNTILNIIPSGNNDQTIPLRNISSAEVCTQHNPDGVLKGIFQIILAFVLKFFWGGILVELLVFVLLFLGMKNLFDANRTTLRIQRSGNDYYLSVPFNSKRKIIRVKNAIDEALTYEAQKTDLYIQADSMGKAFADAMAGQLSEKYLRRQVEDRKAENPLSAGIEVDTENMDKLARNNGISNVVMALFPFLFVFLMDLAIHMGVNDVTEILGEKVRQIEPEEAQEDIQYNLELEDYEYYYMPILQEYQNIAMNNKDENGHEHVNEGYYSNVMRAFLSDKTIYPYALLLDINGDETPELFIAIQRVYDSGEAEYRIIDAYTFCNGDGKQIFSDNSMGYHDVYDICSNGMIRCSVSNPDIDEVTLPVEIKYYWLDENGEVSEAESMNSNTEEFEEFANKYSLYEIQRWNNLKEWNNPLMDY